MHFFITAPHQAPHLHSLTHKPVLDCKHISPPPLPRGIMPVNGFDPLVNLSSSSMATHPHCSSSPPSSSSANATSHSVATSHHQNGQTVDMECTSTASEQMMDSELTVDFSNHLSLSPRESDRADRADRDLQEMTMSILAFEQWTQGRQTEFVEQLIHRMSFHQHEQLYSILMPLLQRDFITALPSEYCTVHIHHQVLIHVSMLYWYTVKHMCLYTVALREGNMHIKASLDLVTGSLCHVPLLFMRLLFAL